MGCSEVQVLCCVEGPHTDTDTRTDTHINTHTASVQLTHQSMLGSHSESANRLYQVEWASGEVQSAASSSAGILQTLYCMHARINPHKPEYTQTHMHTPDLQRLWSHSGIPCPAQLLARGL